MTDADVPQFGQPVPAVAYIDRPGVYALVVRAGALLVIETPAGLFLPGGGIDAGESPEAALRRELLEETGLLAEGFTPLGTARQYVIESATGIGYNKIETFYLVDAVTHHAQPIEPDHTTRWLPLANARSRLREEAQIWATEGIGAEGIGK